ncbi:MAG: PQQ-binding-like beta-propeller repeat protein, partial [Armatimonadota bacterium]
DAATGEVRWSFFTDGPVRLAPTIAGGKVYVGSDDGWVYCLSAADGGLVWKRALVPEARRIPGNGRMISAAPIRTGVLVDDGTAYCLGGIFPSQGVYACALNAEDGSVIWRAKTYKASPQGYLLASATRLYAPTGRTTPTVFDRRDGTLLGSLPGQGGAYAVLSGEMLVSGPGRGGGGLDVDDANTKEHLAVFGGLRMVLHGRMAYLQSETELSALDCARYISLTREKKTLEERLRALQKKQGNEAETKGRGIDELKERLEGVSEAMRDCLKWKQACWHPYSLILVGDTLFAGGQDEVAAFSAADGHKLWTAPVEGKAYGLSAADGSLFVSTDAGNIHCFSGRAVERERVVAAPPVAVPYPQDDLSPVYAAAARHIVERTGASKGYCFVLGAEDGRLAYEIARLTDLQIVCVEEDGEKVAAARKALDRAGVYGVRVSVHHGSISDLTYGRYVANLVVSGRTLASGEPPASPDEVYRLLRPYGGVAYIGQPRRAGGRGRRLTASRLSRWMKQASRPVWRLDKAEGVWAIVRRGRPEEAGEWTSLYAGPGNTACSQDGLEGPFEIQWFGKPGPRRIIDRHHRPMSSLFKDGRLFVPADDAIIAVDAYNGTPLWDLDVPNSRRVGVIKDSGQMVVTDDYLYIAVEDECWGVDVGDGKPSLILKAPQIPSTERHDWGYIAAAGDLLFGTGQKAGASFRKLSVDMINTLEGDFRPVIASDYIFCMDRHTGQVKWTHREGVIMNNCIAIGDGRAYLVESRNQRMSGDEDGRVRIDEFCAADTYILALDAGTGEKIWEHAYRFPFQHIMYVSYAKGVILVAGTRNEGKKVEYDLFAFDAATCSKKWHTAYQPGYGTGGSHGEQWQHPVIIGDTVYSRPFAFDLQTGQKRAYRFDRGGHGCGGLSASRWYLYGRGDNPRMYPVTAQHTSGIPLTYTTRPGCWINIIPAGGLILIPESSSGCTCGYPLQTSIALVPRQPE